MIEERRATDAGLAALLDAAFQELVSRYGPDGRSPVHAQARFLVAVVGDLAIACGALQPTEDPATAELKRMYVVPEHRGRGVGSAVLAALEALAADTGYRRIRLATGLRQPEAMALYERRGYARTEPYGKYLHQPLTRCYHKPLT